MSLWGVETEKDCNNFLNELIALVDQAMDRPEKDLVAKVKTRLKYLHDSGNTNRAQAQMSKLESAHLWRAILSAHAFAPNLNQPKTWYDGLYRIKTDLEEGRPQSV